MNDAAPKTRWKMAPEPPVRPPPLPRTPPLLPRTPPPLPDATSHEPSWEVGDRAEPAAPPICAESAPPTPAEIADDVHLAGPAFPRRLAQRLWRSLREGSPWLTSLVAHAAILIVLSYWLMPFVLRGQPTMLVLSTAADKTELESSQVAALDIFQPDSREEAQRREQAENVPQPVEPVIAVETSLLTASEPAIPAESLSETISVASDTTLARPEKQGPLPPRSTDEGLKEATSVVAAADVVTGEIARQMDEGDMLVVWLFDASISLVGDRPAMAARLEEFFRGIGGFNESHWESDREHVLMHAVVAYGAATRELVPPTRYGAKVVTTLPKVPIDPTGLENVMSAIQQSVLYYRGTKRRKDRMMIVVWTDESGDDTLMLEETIELCRRAYASVHVIGPSAVFGSEQGTHLWVDPPTGHEFLLPVKRGPDTSLPERILLPYWFENSLPPWEQDGARVARNVPWHGGPYREGLLAGVGPYALTRLCLQTGGTYTIYDREADRSPFRLEALRPYLPSYDSPAAYLASLEEHPLRKAVSNAVLLSIQHRRSLAPPALRCIATRSRNYPFSVRGSGYIDPVVFRVRLGEFLVGEQLRAAESYVVVERALAEFEDRRKVSFEEEYENEDSLRWRAWHDLTRGRLLAVSVRYEEYAALCELIKRNMHLLQPTTNSIRILPSSELRVPRSVQRAEEARVLLQRCRDEHPDTPWAYLAKWELDNPVGVYLQEVSIPPPPPAIPGPPARPSPPGPRYVFPRL